METSTIRSARNELLVIFLIALVLTFIMVFVEGLDRLYIFAGRLHRYHFGEFAVFFPAFLAIGFVCFSYRRVRELESEIARRSQLEMALRESEKKYKDLSITDELTRLYNSRYFTDRLKGEIDRTMRYNRPLSMIVLDIDNFKHYNDAYGHMEGNKVLSVLGAVIRDCIRRTDTAFRYGGEEFTIILPETPTDGAVGVAERVRAGIASEVFSPRPDEVVKTTVSLGVCQYEPGEGTESFIRRTDSAMYASKRQGKNRVSVAEPIKGQ